MAIVRQFLRFSGVGAVGTVVHFAILILLVELFGATAIGASISGFVSGAATNYVLNYRYTFSSTTAHWRAAPRYALVAASGAVLNLLIMNLGLDTLRLHYLIAQCLATALVLFWGFLLNRLWTFRT